MYNGCVSIAELDLLNLELNDGSHRVNYGAAFIVSILSWTSLVRMRLHNSLEPPAIEVLTSISQVENSRFPEQKPISLLHTHPRISALLSA